MIIVLILIALVILGLIGLAISCISVTHTTHGRLFSWYWFDNEPLAALSGTVGGINLVALLICSVICICGNTNYAVHEEEIKIAEHVVKLEKEYANLITYYEESISKDIDISSSNLPTKINEHNEEVHHLIVDIKTNQSRRKNPWISWFVNKYYDSKVDLSRIEATYVTLN